MALEESTGHREVLIQLSPVLSRTVEENREVLSTSLIDLDFLQLLDQIVFETSQRDEPDDPIRHYVYRDLFNRLYHYALYYTDREKYAELLKMDQILVDDASIIHELRLWDFTENLINTVEGDGNPLLMKVLLYSPVHEETLPFFHNITQGNYYPDLKVIACAGIVLAGSSIHCEKSQDPMFCELIDYANSFSLTSLEKNNLPSNSYESLFAILILEHERRQLRDERVLRWFLKSAEAYNRINANSDELFHSAIEKTVLSIAPSWLDTFLGSRPLCEDFMKVLDFLPARTFETLQRNLRELSKHTLHLMSDRMDETPETFGSLSNMRRFLMYSFSMAGRDG
jgi:hypothetical protein